MPITISSIMLSKLVTCDATSKLKEVAKKIIDEDVGSVLIKKGEHIVGIITEKDLLRTALRNKDFDETQAAEVMSSPLDCCEADDSVEKCMELFKETKRTRIIVKREGKVVDVMRRKIVERFLNLSQKYSLAEIAKSPRFKTGRH